MSKWRLAHCVFCGKAFLAGSWSTKYCSKSCRVREENAVRMLERTTPRGAA